MSFGAGNTTKSAENNLAGTTNTLLNTQAPRLNTAGGNLLNLGEQTVQPGVNFFNTLLSGNAANTTAMLQPNIDQIRRNQAATLTGINTLMPRGGGRSSTLFGQSFSAQPAIQSLFNPLRAQAAEALPQIGLGQMGVGTNLFNLGNQALGTAGNQATNLAGLGQADTRRSDTLAAGLAGGLLKLLTVPIGGGMATGGLLGGI